MALKISAGELLIAKLFKKLKNKLRSWALDKR
jgi:hypothetical protein